MMQDGISVEHPNLYTIDGYYKNADCIRQVKAGRQIVIGAGFGHGVRREPQHHAKALGELEWEKLVYTVRTTGRYVTEDEELIHGLRKELAEMRISEFFSELKKLGYSKEEIRGLLESYMEGMVEDDSVSTI